MARPEDMIRIASTAVEIEERHADAAALLIDAAAMIASELGMNITELSDRLSASFDMFNTAQDALAKTGAAATRKQ